VDKILVKTASAGYGYVSVHIKQTDIKTLVVVKAEHEPIATVGHHKSGIWINQMNASVYGLRSRKLLSGWRCPVRKIQIISDRKMPTAGFSFEVSNA
jgi:hypothetical protein